MADPMNKSKALGTSWESAIVAYLQQHGFDVERRALSGNNDRGDIAGLSGFVIEAKNEKQISLAQYMTEAEREAVNAGEPYYAAIVKRRMKPVGDGYVVMPLKIFVKFLLWWTCSIEEVADDVAGDEGH